MPVAKSYQKLKQIGDPYNANGRMYVNVETAAGTIKTVRWYTETEYHRMYPNEPIEAKITFKNQKEALGFQKGYITIFKGDTYANLEWFQQSIARYCKWWGWYIVSTDELPDPLPAGIEPIRLTWESVGTAAGDLKTDSLIKNTIDALLYEQSPSEYQGVIGDRLELELTVTKVYSGENAYGNYTVHIFEDANQNQYVWSTNSKSWEVGSRKFVRGTVKEHKTTKNVKQTILTRVMERKN